MKHHAFGARSLQKLSNCHPHLQEVFPLALNWCPFDMTIVFGWRGEEAQEEAFRLGNSEKRWPESKHNKFMKVDGDLVPQSLAVDAGPWLLNPNTDKFGIPWRPEFDDPRAFSVMSGCVFAAHAFINERDGTNIQMRWGGDWDRDGLTIDQKFMDLAHFELIL